MFRMLWCQVFVLIFQESGRSKLAWLTPLPLMWLTAREMCSDTVLQIQDSTSRESKLPAPNPPDVTKREKQSGKDSSLMIKFCSKSLWTGHTVQASSTWWLESPICPSPCLCELVVQLVQNGGRKVPFAFHPVSWTGCLIQPSSAWRLESHLLSTLSLWTACSVQSHSRWWLKSPICLPPCLWTGRSV